MKFIFKILLILYLVVGTVPNLDSLDKVVTQWLYLNFLNTFALFFLVIKGYPLKKYFFNKTSILFLALFIWSSISLFFAINKVESIVVLSQLFAIIITFIITMICLSEIERPFRFISNILSFYLIVELITIYLPFLNSATALDQIYSRSSLFLGFAANVNITAFSIIYKIPFLIYSILQLKKFKIISFISSFVIFALIIFASGTLNSTRGAIITYTSLAPVLLIISIVIYFKSKEYKLMIISIIYSLSEDQTYQVLNPSVGLSYEVAPQQRLFANFSSSFETPALSELSANPSGAEGLNLELKPARALNYEFGWKGLWAKTRMEANVFFIESTNEILPYELEAFPGRSFYRNAGATQRWGVEVFGSHQWKQWELQASMTQAQYRFTENNTSEGNTLPGIPNSQFFLQLGYTSLQNWQFQLTGEHIGSLYADTANAVQIEAFQKVRLLGGKTIALGNLELNLFAGINNLFDVRYFDNIRLNAFGGRYYEPAPGRNVFFGLSAAF